MPGDADAGGRGLRVSATLLVPWDEVTVRATTSGGPGGQHANVTRSRVEVTFDVTASAALGPRQRARLLDRLGPVVRASAADTRSGDASAIEAVQALAQRRGSLHEAHHEAMEALGEMVWASQRSGLPFDGEAYIERIRMRAGH